MYVVDDDPNSLSANGWLEDVSKVKKYVMSDEEYERREGTYRKWKQEQLAKDPGVDAGETHGGDSRRDVRGAGGGE